MHLLVESAARSLDVQQQVERARKTSKQHGALGTVWFDESTSDKVAIYVYDASHTRVAKRVLHSPEVDAAAAEELAVVVRAAIDSLLAGEDVAMDVVPMPAPAPIEEPPPAAAPAPRRRVRCTCASVSPTRALHSHQVLGKMAARSFSSFARSKRSTSGPRTRSFQR